MLEPVIIYTDVIEKKKGERYEQAERARNMGAMLFNKDLTFINFGLPFSRRVIKFYVISDDENEKVRHSAHIIKAYDKPGVSLYLFSDDIRSEKLLASQKIENRFRRHYRNGTVRHGNVQGAYLVLPDTGIRS